MKTLRYIFSLLLVFAGLLTTYAQDQHQRALYNYRNDNNFHAFMDIDVDSITYSCIDTLGVEHEDIVVQEVWTPDSLYRIPLEAIDSIGFWAPKPEMNPDVFYLRDYHAAYTTSINGRTLHLSRTISRDSIPSVGNVLLSVTQQTPYEEGFTGKVIEVNNNAGGIEIVCEAVSIGDIFKRLVLVGKVSNDTETLQSRVRSKSGSEPWVNIEDYDVFPIPLDQKEFHIGELITITSPHPKLTCSYYLYISELWYEGSVQLDLQHPDLTYTLTLSGDQLKNYSSYGKALVATFTSNEACKEWLEKYKKGKIEDYQKEQDRESEELFKSFFEKTKIKIPIPLPTTGLLNMELQIAPIVQARGDFEFNTELKTDARQSMTVKWKGFTPMKIAGIGMGLPDIPYIDVYAQQDPFKSAKVDFKITGALTLGLKTLLDINLIHYDLIHLGVGCDFNLFEAGVDINMTLLDTEHPEMNLYDRFKDTDIKVSSYATIYAEAGISPYKWFNGKFLKTKLYKKEKVYNIFPHFTEPTLPEYNNGHWQSKQPLTLFSYPSKDVYLPCKIGMRVIDDQGTPVKEYQSSLQYLDALEWQYKSIDLDVSDLPTGGSYKCYPTISFFGLPSFNAGPVHIFQTPLKLVATPNEVTLAKGNTTFIDIFGGWDHLALVIVGDDVASIVHDSESDVRHIKILAKKEGTAALKIEDLRTGEELLVPVTVISETLPLTLSTTSLNVEASTSKSVQITSGSGSYTATSFAPAIATAVISGNNVVITGNSSGSTYITVKDTQSNQTATISVTVVDATPDLALSSNAVSVNVGESSTVNITSGSGSYTATSFAPAVATAVISENNIVITGNSSGSTYITVKDTQSNQTATISVTVVDAIPNLALSSNAVSVNVGESSTVDITSGSGSYTATSFAPAIATAVISGNIVVITGNSSGSTYITVKDTQSNQTATISVTVADTTPDLTISTNTVSIEVGGTSTVEITAGSGNYTVVSNKPAVATAALNGMTITITGVAAGAANITVSDTQSGKTATISVTVTAADNPSTDAVAVDLGLPSGTKWADRNVGASKPEDYGGYYAWGETEEKEVYNWSTYKWCNGSEKTLTKYCTNSSFGIVDNKTMLDPEDDVAHVKWGGSWYMPTREQMDELLNYCTSEWTTVNGINGRKFTGSNGNSIFIPAASFIYDSELLGVGLDGRYWSLSLYESFPSVSCNLFFNSGDALGNRYGRYQGQCVRPVISGTITPDLTLSITTVSLEVGGSSTVEITAGSGIYTVISDKPSVATAELSGSNITITPVAAGTATITVTDTQSGQSATIVVTVTAANNPSQLCPDDDHPHMIDLGLPSGVNWSCCNVDATSPEDYGGYYAWGETEEKDAYNWSTYKWCNGSWDTLTKYCTKSSYGTVDNVIMLDPEDDVAHVKWGDSWKIPTIDQVKELLNNCSSEWIIVNGINGCKLTSKINGNSIFIPAAGYRSDSDLRKVGYYGVFWSSSLYESVQSYAHGVSFDSDGADRVYPDRISGRSVRPVISDTITPDLTLSTNTVFLKVGGASTVVITAGSGIYTVVSDKPSVATAELSGSTITITPVAAGTATITVSDTHSGQTATIAVTVTAADNPTTDAVAVDLGLPSGTKWADRNVGASSPEDYGGYYAWGETEEKEVYNWSTYKWCNGSYDSQTKYCTDSSYGTVDNNTELDPEDDVAHVKWGGSWKMPTLDQVKELLDNCSSEWTTVNGINGRRFTGPNGNSIFLPAAGYRGDSGLYNAGSYGDYWSSTLGESYPYYAYNPYFNSGRAHWSDFNRGYGRSVRPVR